MSRRTGITRVGLALTAAAALLTTACSDAPSTTAPGAAVRAPNVANQRGPRAGALLSRGAPGLNVFANDPAIAVISNGLIQLGVNAEGHLNVPGNVESTGGSTTSFVGLRYLPTNGEATAPGCLCEGWGAADVASESFGYANEDSDGGAHNMVVESFTSTATTAVSVVIIHAIDPCIVDPVTPDPTCVPDNFESGEGPIPGHRLGGARLRVTHDYHPSPVTQNLYEATVTIENLTDGPMGDVRYRRVMDWDIAPNTFTEYVTVGGTAGASNVLHADNNGFQTANPMAAPEGSSLAGATYVTGDFVDAGAEDIGAMFEFGFGRVEPFASVTFKIFYGAAHDQSHAAAALAAVGAEVFSFGQASWDGNGDPLDACGGFCALGAFGGNTGRPHTFIFAFSGVGGDPLIPPVARAGGPYAPRLEGAVRSFADGGSSDADGTIVSHEWNFNDGTPHLFGNPVSHAFYDNGVFPVTLRVTDDDGLSGEDTKFVTVLNAPPNVFKLRLESSTQNMTRVGKPFWAGWSFRDPGLLDSPWAWRITWGDGTSNIGFESLQGEVITGHTYATPGTKTVKFTITDKDGASHSRTIPVIVMP